MLHTALISAIPFHFNTLHGRSAYRPHKVVVPVVRAPISPAIGVSLVVFSVRKVAQVTLGGPTRLNVTVTLISLLIKPAPAPAWVQDFMIYLQE